MGRDLLREVFVEDPIPSLKKLLLLPDFFIEFLHYIPPFDDLGFVAFV